MSSNDTNPPNGSEASASKPTVPVTPINKKVGYLLPPGEITDQSYAESPRQPYDWADDSDSPSIPPRVGMHRPTSLKTNPKHPDPKFLRATIPSPGSGPTSQTKGKQRKNFFDPIPETPETPKTPERKHHVRPDGTPTYGGLDVDGKPLDLKKSPEVFGHRWGYHGFRTPPPPGVEMVTPGTGYRPGDDGGDESE